MYPLFESIRVEGGRAHLLQYHQNRLNRSYLKLFKTTCPWTLESILPELPPVRLFKLRFKYNKDSFSFETLKYTPSKIESLKLVEINSYSYDFKFTDRSGIDQAFNLRGDCDDVLMTKNGLLADTSYCNILLFDGTDWITPAQPLFKGVQRNFLIDQQIIKTKQIYKEQLSKFKFFQLINALNSFDKNIKFSVDCIK